MPWDVKQSDQCPADKPWAVIKKADGSIEGCHPTEDAAKQQQAALYANEPAARSDEREDEPVEARSEDRFETDKPELRSVPFTDLETSADGGTFEGYAAVFDREADLGDFTESIQRGAFRKALSASGNVPMLYDHNPTMPVLATTRAGTLQLEEDAKGLRVKATVANHFMGEAVRELVKTGDISGMSFGFVAGKGNSRVDTSRHKLHRELLGFKRLLDVSPTWDPAYEGTDAVFRSLRALQVAESVEQAQQVLSGAHQQLEDGEPAPEVDADDAVDVRSGVASPRLVAARNRLRLMAIQIPKEFRDEKGRHSPSP